jgi:uncharacterized protein (TIGR00255 family)
MTAFARLDKQDTWGSLSLELRSVNHRYLEMSLRLPEELRQLEPVIRDVIGQSLKRGKLDCNVRYQPPQGGDAELNINEGLARRLGEISREADHFLYNPAPVNSMDVLRWPGVLQTAEPDWDAVRGSMLEMLRQALAEMVANREREGDKLKQLIEQRLDGVGAAVTEVRSMLPEILQRQRDKLTERLQELSDKLDMDRVEQEIVIMAQKMDVAEELDRLTAHVDEVHSVLQKDEPTGRRLDFLMQELNREANTLGSKSVDTRTTRASVDLKVLIEQMREQVQNIE